MPVPRRLGAPASRSRLPAAAVGLLLGLLLTGCTSRSSTPASAPPPIPGTFEEAAFIADGEMSRVYGADADPVPRVVTGDIVERDGEPVWRLDATYEVTVDGRRRTHRWTLWVGASDEAALAVLDADGPSPAPIP